jgi:putative FmdB family regulatory protein
MPVYSFICSVCGERFERKSSFSEDHMHFVCPNGHEQVRRVYSAPAVFYKGSGFYVTDHRKQPTGERSS